MWLSICKPINFIFTVSSTYFYVQPICNVECDEFFVMNFIMFVLSKFRTKLLSANHLIICKKTKFDTKPEEVCKFDIHVIWPLCYEVDVLFIWVMIISTQTVSCLSHYNNMIWLDKVITKLPQILSNISKMCIVLKNTRDFIFSAQVFFERGSTFPHLATSKYKIFLFWLFVFQTSGFTMFSTCFRKPVLCWLMSSKLNLFLGLTWYTYSVWKEIEELCNDGKQEVCSSVSKCNQTLFSMGCVREKAF